MNAGDGYPCKQIDTTKFAAVVWEDRHYNAEGTGHKPWVGRTTRFMMLGAFLMMDDAVNFAIKEQEASDEECKQMGYENTSIIWAEKTSGDTLHHD